MAGAALREVSRCLAVPENCVFTVFTEPASVSEIFLSKIIELFELKTAMTMNLLIYNFVRQRPSASPSFGAHSRKVLASRRRLLLSRTFPLSGSPAAKSRSCLLGLLSPSLAHPMGESEATVRDRSIVRGLSPATKGKRHESSAQAQDRPVRIHPREGA